MKLSKKQKDIIDILRKDKESSIIFMKGLVPRCLMSNNIEYKISTATMFALEKLEIIKKIKDDWNSSEYILTELGKTINLD